MSTVDMSKILGGKVEDAKRKPLPTQGIWKFLVLGYAFEKSKQKGTDCVAFKLKYVEPQGDVDPSALAEYESEMKDLGVTWENEEFKHQAWLSENPNTKVMLREFIEKCGVAVTGRTFDECLPETKGCYILGTIFHEPMQKRPGEFNLKISQFFAAE